ncbi:MAG TPA: RsmE family RNA methyltransferase [Thermoanaerobaculia bacterium]|nr:RsmE family RNA methyltransferase [Thermoanaerobaculia bacterium]
MTTLLVPPDLFDGAEVRVEGDPYRHLFRARRLAAGERLRVVDGRGRARWAEVARVERSGAALALGEPAPANEPAFRLELLVAVFRPERAAWLVEKATEVGVGAVRFLHTERAPRTFGAGTLERLRRVAAAAVEQCGRSRLPEVSGVHDWGELARLADPLPDRRLLDPAAAVEWRGPAGAAGALLVGPEGGWTEAEVAAARVLGFAATGLGPRTLRAETAAVVAASRLLL